MTTHFIIITASQIHKSWKKHKFSDSRSYKMVFYNIYNI